MVINTLLTDERARAYDRAIEAQGRGPIAFVALPTSGEDRDVAGAALGVAVANERGYHPVPLGWARFHSMISAQANADQLNKEILGMSTDVEARIVTSTMGGKAYFTPHNDPYPVDRNHYGNAPPPDEPIDPTKGMD